MRWLNVGISVILYIFLHGIGGIFFQLNPMDTDQVHELRISVVESHVRMVYRTFIYVMHTRIHDIHLDEDTGNCRRGIYKLITYVHINLIEKYVHICLNLFLEFKNVKLLRSNF